MDLKRLGISAITSAQWSAGKDLQEYAQMGIQGIGLWRSKLQDIDLLEYRRQLMSRAMTVTNLCFTGQFTLGVDAAIQDGMQALQTAEHVGADIVLVISGPIGDLTMKEADQRVVDGLQELAVEAHKRHIKLALEALHPMDMTQWSIIPTVDKALDLIDKIHHDSVGLMLDFYNTWWDPKLPEAIERSRGRILCVQLADWRNPTRSFTDRTVPGRGVAPLADLIAQVESTGYSGWYDLEIFSDELWALDDYRPLLQEMIRWWSNVGEERDDA